MKTSLVRLTLLSAVVGLMGCNGSLKVQQGALEQFFQACFNSDRLSGESLLVYTGPVEYETGDLWLHVLPDPPDRRESLTKNVGAEQADALRTRLDDSRAVTCTLDTSKDSQWAANAAATAAMIPLSAGAGLDITKGRITRISADKAWLDEIDRSSKFAQVWSTAFNPAHPVSLGISEGQYKVAAFAMRVKGYRVQYKGSNAASLGASGSYTAQEVGDLKGDVKWTKSETDQVDLYVEGPTNVAFILRPLAKGFEVQDNDEKGLSRSLPTFVVPEKRGGEGF